MASIYQKIEIYVLVITIQITSHNNSDQILTLMLYFKSKNIPHSL